MGVAEVMNVYVYSVIIVLRFRDNFVATVS